MKLISQFLNKRFSTRNLTDSEFDGIIVKLSEELSEFDFLPKYSKTELLLDWKNLVEWNKESTTINSTSRIGMKLCEHFFPNFWNIEDSKGNSFKKLWKTPKVMEKVLRWNRKSHSTPYLSELKRGIYFCAGLCKSTMYRPQIAKSISKGSSRVLDPCMGWGGRMLGAVSSGAHYIGFDPNTETFKYLQELSQFLGIESKVTLICDDALNMSKYDIGMVDTVMTSPPYFDLEIYSNESTQSVFGSDTYEAWNKNFLTPLIHSCVSHLSPNGKSCWNVAKVKGNDMSNSVDIAHKEIGFFESEKYSVVSSARQTNQTKTKNKKSTDSTVVYRKGL